MVRTAVVSFALSLGAILAAVSMSAPQEAIAAKACKRTTFETKLVADACAKGGQGEAKKAMKAWTKKAKKQDAKLECGSCHSKLAPKYELKPEGLQKFKDLGGK
jgi:hypothetical protein